jgi:small-conductance mechanosensitive channel
MSSTTLRIIVTIVLFVHGIGHAMGIIPALGVLNVGNESSPSGLRNWSSHSWLLTKLLGDTAARIVSIVLFGAALVGFIGAALGLLGWLVPHELWRTLAIASAVISLVTIALYWKALILFFPHKVCCTGADVATLVCLLWMQWPSEASLGF